MKPTAFELWTIEKKHDLRELYANFLTDTGVPVHQITTSDCTQFDELLAIMYKN